MSRPFRAICAVIVLMLMTLSVLITFSPNVAAASTTWTSDADFTAPGAGGSTPVFTGTEVVGTGTPARVDIVKDNTDWVNKNPSTSPGVREGPGMTFASSSNVFVLFGGYSTRDLDDTWEYNLTANTWTKITTSPRPAGREWPGLSYDPGQNVVVLFGGVNGTNGFLSDTWEFNVAAGTWSQQSPPTSPPPLVDYPLVYYASQSRHVVFGQDIVSGQMQTWAYNAAAHTWANRTPSGSPSVRSGFAMTYHAARDRVVLFGGAFFMTLLAETWEYNWVSNAWGQVFPSGSPAARAGHSMTYRPVGSVAYLFGGQTSSGQSQETWAYSAAGAWTSVGTNTHPPPRQYAGFADDTTHDVAILYGGSASGSPLGDTWALGASYRAAGKYTSVVFDSGGANVVWGTIWWNKTPPNQPANTFLRFQLAASNSVNPASWDYGGPDCQVTSYYTSVGATIGDGTKCLDNKRYLRFLADFGSLDTQVTPSLEDITITYTVPPSPPYIVITDPADLTFSVPTNKVIHIVFSKAMNTATLTWQFLRGPPVNFVPLWSPDHTEVDLTHTQLLGENKVYQLQIAVNDTTGAPLVPNPVDSSVVNPWIFVTEKINPTITSTIPTSGAANVANNSNIVVNFSEPMNRTSLQVSITPDVTFVASWSNNDQTVTLSHAVRFSQCISYTIGINATDLANLPLIPGTAPNPWSFDVACPNPYITAENPSNLQPGVALNAPVIVDFSEAMATATVTFTIVPTVTGQSLAWSNGNSRLTMTHSGQFAMCGVYTVTITGRDADENLPLIDNPRQPSVKNPWKFVAICNNPYMVFTNPADGDTGVSVTKDVQIGFSDQMDTTSLLYTVTGGPWTEVNRQWAGPSVLLTLMHIPFQECRTYTFTVTQARNQAGAPLVPGPAPNPWSFDTECVSPYVVNTNPANASVLIPVNQPIFVNFSAPMNTSTVIFTSNPSTSMTMSWSNNDQMLTLNHATDFVACQQYQAYVDGNGKDGRALLTGGATPFAPNPWVFTTRCPGFYIARTDPAHQQTDVPFTYPIQVEFSQAANPATFSMSVSPSAGTLTPSWSGGNTIVTVTHSGSFTDCALYTVTVSAKDTGNNNLVNVTGSKPNPWQFRAHCVPPQILSTNPRDGDVGVPQASPITVTFSEPMNPASISWTISPNIGLTSSMSGGNTVLTLTHSTPFTGGIQYCVTINGRDVDGILLVPGPVPNPFCFTTASGLPAPTGLRVSGPGPNDVILTWNSVPGAASYVVYHSLNRLAAWPWSQLGTVTSPAYVHTGAWNDGTTHYYIVRAKDATNLQSGNSTMGVKLVFPINFNGVSTNIYWFSLPYRSKYHTAKDISDELTSIKIDVVAKWNPATQSSILWTFFRGSWRGANFAINPGDGLYIGVRSSFSWVVNGTDGSVSHGFTLYPPPNANLNWFSLPYTSPYTKASDLVTDIEGGTGPTAHVKIDIVARWNPATQSLQIYQWQTSGWTGTDFVLAPGDGIYFRITSSFNWTPRLITPEVP